MVYFNKDIPNNIRLVGGTPTPLKNMSSSMGRMTSHIYDMENNIHLWNHQPVKERLRLKMRIHWLYSYKLVYKPP